MIFPQGHLELFREIFLIVMTCGKCYWQLHVEPHFHLVLFPSIKGLPLTFCIIYEFLQVFMSGKVFISPLFLNSSLTNFSTWHCSVVFLLALFAASKATVLIIFVPLYL
jgi:hypothetical protein